MQLSIKSCSISPLEPPPGAFRIPARAHLSQQQTRDAWKLTTTVDIERFPDEMWIF